MADLVSIAQHRERVLALAQPNVLSGVPLDQAYGHVLAGEVHAILANPIFDNSAMDGFALHAADVAGTGPWVLPVAGDIPAGAPRIECPPGHVVRVMTGAPVPPGADILVVPVEQTDVPAGPLELPEQITVRTVDLHRSHIRPAGGKHPAGAVVADAGTRVDAGTLAALTSAGVQAVDVYARPTVAMISTGDELVPWPDVPGASQLPDSNLPMIAALAVEHGAAEVRRFHSGDRGRGLAELLDEASACDVIVTTGGISAGAFDVVREVVGPREGSWFGPVAQRPGTPQGVAPWGEATLVCLPGNPVAAYVSFLLYVAPLLAVLGTGNREARAFRPLQAVAGPGFAAPRKGRSLVVPVRLSDGDDAPVAVPFSTGSHNSSDVTALTGIDGFTIIEPSSEAAAGGAAERGAARAAAPAEGDPLLVHLLGRGTTGR
ncbi:molybdopterin molybdotransferase MoeA [Corynebacterium sp. UMB9976]|uniref:molybdopterin molybdotransferase MoeA n=1 Tax=Corynebacterium sp. UMB9976 TaxID=3046354 RepID=UPI0025514932|nr:molybdopterin molybdotransferase MoeA [Corynebacterium sp. UMB9976]